MNNFYKDLEKGKIGEVLAAQALTARGHIVEDVSDDWKYRRADIDFLLTNKQGQKTTLEVKTDAASENTGNFFIEYYNSNNKSHSYDGWLNYCAAEYITGDGIEHLIIEVPRNGCSAKINPETVGQYTGL